jgi:hypothetical protein
MDLVTAHAVLGVEAGTAWPDVRAAYLRLVRRHHPDAAFDLADSGARTLLTAQITEAFAVVVAAQQPVADDLAAGDRPVHVPVDDPGARLRHPSIALDDSRTVLLDAAPMEALLAIHESFSIIGVVSYIDRLSLVIETIVTPTPGRATSLLAWLDPLPDGLTQVTVGVESLGGHPPADLDELVDELARLLASPRTPLRDT